MAKKEMKVNKAGLSLRQDDVIFVGPTSSQHWTWGVWKTHANSSTATHLFTFETYDDAAKAGCKIAQAIGGLYSLSDPRK